MPRVLIYSLVFPPDGVSTARLMGDLAEDLVREGHEVCVVTTTPHYNRDVVAEAEQPLMPLPGTRLLQSSFRGVRVLHTPVPSDRRTRLGRLRSWLTFHMGGFLAAVRHCPRAEIIIVPSPLLTAAVVAWFITLVRGGRYIYNVQELYPDLAEQMTMVRNPLALLVLRFLERFAYARAAAVTGITPGMCTTLATRTRAEKVHLIPNFVDLREVTPQGRTNGLSTELGLDDAFVVSYAGNIGYAQGLDTVLRAARQCADERVRFVLVGGGALRAQLVTQIRKNALTNVLLLEHQPYTRMAELHGASDACLVPLRGAVDRSALPSKVLRIMAWARPVVALCDPQSELADLVRSAGAGVIVPYGDAEALLAAIQSLSRDAGQRAAMGESGRRFVERFHERRRVTARYAQLVTALAVESCA